jgi:thiamine-monophosphate kinase
MANVADVLAMGASPTFAVWSVGMGKSWTDSVFAGLAEGALQACAQYGIQLVGGDTVRCLDSGFVSLTLLGQPWGQPWLRSGAKAGDWLVVCGDLGYSAAGLALLQHAHVWPTELDVLVERHRRPRCPAVASLQALGAAVHAALDVSDGLSSECQHLAHQSGVGIVLKPYFWPADPLLEQAAQWLNQSSLGWVLHGGEDHSCLLAVAPHTPLPASCRVLGECVAGEGVWLETPEHTKQLLTPHGWTHT